ncbi:unnamed protein product [Moneuplotes crassus]|uniref:Uncharacterized protein n=1 Tax=Euplotes crassus TaxID=5936 RepID=A0AAD1UGX8_EUPCR|nr:unnamed protein product [Moneuplotes crassus]
MAQQEYLRSKRKENLEERNEVGRMFTSSLHYDCFETDLVNEALSLRLSLYHQDM